MEELFNEMEADAQAMHPDDQALKDIATMAAQLEEKQAEVAEAEATLKELQKEERRLAEKDLPERLLEVGMEKFTLSDGTEISVKEDMKMSLPKNPEKRAAAAQWLKDHGLDTLVKEEVKTYDSDEAKKALDQLGVAYEVEENMHTGAVKSALKELQDEGVDVPLEMFGGYEYRRAKVNR